MQVAKKVGICPQLSQETLWPGALPRGGLSNNQNNGSKPPSGTAHRRSVTAVRPSREPPACHLKFFGWFFMKDCFNSVLEAISPYCQLILVRTVTNINLNPDHETPRYCGRPLPASVRTVTNINSSTGHETPRYCGRPLPPPRLAFIILLKVVPIPVGPPTPQSPA